MCVYNLSAYNLRGVDQFLGFSRQLALPDWQVSDWLETLSQRRKWTMDCVWE